MSDSGDVHAIKGVDGEDILENGDGRGTHDTSGANHITRAEKKIMRLLQKLGLKQVTGFRKCEIRRGRSIPIAVKDPVVFAVPGKQPTYIILGPIRLDDVREEIKDQIRSLQGNRQAAMPQGVIPTVVEMGQKPVEETGGEDLVDDTGLNADDIKLAIEQTGKSKAEVVAALRKAQGDVIEAIMQLSN